MADSNSSSKEHEDRTEYAKKAQSISSLPTRAYGYGKAPVSASAPDANDDDSNNLFMSEPSISEADDFSDDHMRMLSPLGSFDDEEEEQHDDIDDEGDADADDEQDGERDYGLPPPPPSQPYASSNRIFPSFAPASPGSTSLSSWESSHFNSRRRVLLHFSPDPRGADASSYKSDNSSQQRMPTPVNYNSNINNGNNSSSNTSIFNYSTNTNSVYNNSTNYNNSNDIAQDGFLASALIPPSAGTTKTTTTTTTPDRSLVHSSNSTSPASEGQRRRIESFLEDLRRNSQGQVQDSSDTANLSFGSNSYFYYLGNPKNATTIDFNGILRPHGTTTSHGQPNLPLLMPEPSQQAPPQQSSSQQTSQPQPQSSETCEQPYLHSRIASMDTAIVQNTASPDGSLDPSSQEDHGNVNSNDKGKGESAKNSNSIDDNIQLPRNSNVESVVMVLSDDSGDDYTKPLLTDDNDDSTASTHPPLVWEEKMLTEDELELNSPRHDSFPVDNVHSKQQPDILTTTAATNDVQDDGRIEMENIPLPSSTSDKELYHDGSDSTDYHQHLENSGHLDQLSSPEVSFRSQGQSRTEFADATPTFDWKKQAEIENFSKFALGTAGGGDSVTRRNSRSSRQRRGSHTIQRNSSARFDSEDSSSVTSSGLSPHVLPSSQPSSPSMRELHVPMAQLPEPHWNMPYRQPYQQQHPQFRSAGSMPWSPQTHHQFHHHHHPTGLPPMGHRNHFHHQPSPSWSPTWHHNVRDIDNSSRYSSIPSPRSQHGVDGQSFVSRNLSPQSESPIFSHSAGPPPVPPVGNSWAYNSAGSFDSAFSWLSAKASRVHSETSPLIADRKLNQESAPSRGTSNRRFGGDSSDSDDNGTGESPPSKSIFPPSPLVTFGKTLRKADRRRFLPVGVEENECKYPTFVCPVCKTRQREFFTVSNAPRQFESASGYIAFYFSVYVIAALYIFGLQEGWSKLDCIYFAVITLTTAGLGDFVPTSDGAKVVCSIFIYFGVACIGLLLGSYIAGMMDERTSQAARANRIKSCPNCVRNQNIRDAAEKRRRLFRKQQRLQRRLYQRTPNASDSDAPEQSNAKRVKRQHTDNLSIDEVVTLTQTELTSDKSTINQDSLGQSNTNQQGSEDGNRPNPPPRNETFQNGPHQQHGGIPNSRQFFHQPIQPLHARHASVDGRSSAASSFGKFSGGKQLRKYSADLGVPATIMESNFGQSMPLPSPDDWDRLNTPDVDSDEDDDESSGSLSSSDSSATLDLENETDGVKNARYVFLTLREALLNSLVIIGFGCFGFYMIEGFTFVDSWYFTTVLLTTVGYGDLVPYTKGGKLFATVYILVAGTMLLNNMSMISMIPLELRRRRTEKAVLTQFGDSLDDMALRELATGPLVRRLHLATDDLGELDECTREMFCLAMLVRLGKVTEEDIKLTMAAFKKLDVNDEKVLNSRAIIAGMIQKRRTGALVNGKESHPLTTPTAQSQQSYGSTMNSPWSDPASTSRVTPNSDQSNNRRDWTFDSRTPSQDLATLPEDNCGVV